MMGEFVAWHNEDPIPIPSMGRKLYLPTFLLLGFYGFHTNKCTINGSYGISYLEGCFFFSQPTILDIPSYLFEIFFTGYFEIPAGLSLLVFLVDHADILSFFGLLSSQMQGC